MAEKSDRTSKNAAGTKAAKPKRRLWRFVVLALVILIANLVWFFPRLASTAAARNYIVSTVNGLVKGSIRIEGLSFSWFGPCEVRGVTVLDAEGREVLTVPAARLAGGVWNVLRSWENFHSIGAEIVHVSLYVGPDGRISLIDALSLRKPGPAKPLPALRGTLKLDSASVTVALADGRTVEVPRVDLEADLDTLSNVSGELKIEAPGGGTVKGRFDMSGLVRDGELRPLEATITFDAETDPEIDLAPILAFASGRKDITGKMSFKVNAKVAQGRTEGDFRLKLVDFRSAELEAADVRPLDLDISAVAAAGPNGLGGHFRLSGEPGYLDASFSLRPRAEPFAFSTRQVMAALLTGENASLPELSVEAEGRIDLVALAQAVPALLKIRRGVKVTGGVLEVRSLSIRGGESPAASGSIEVKDLGALVDGRMTQFDPASFAFDALIESGKGLRVNRAELKSGFARIDAVGGLNQLEASFEANLAGLYQQLSRVFDVGSLELDGTSKGKLTAGRAGDNAVQMEFVAETRKLRYARGDQALLVQTGSTDARGTVKLEERSSGGYALKEAQFDVVGEARGAAFKDRTRSLQIDSVAAGARGSMEFENQSLRKLTLRDADVTLDGETKTACSGWMDLAGGGFKLNASVERANVERVVKKAEGLGFDLSRLHGFSGAVDGRGTLERAKAGEPIVSTGLATVSRATLDGRAVGTDKISFEWSEARLGPGVNLLTLKQGRIDAPPVASVAASRLKVSLAEPVMAEAVIESLQADLALALPVVKRVLKQEGLAAVSGRIDLAGELSSKVTVPERGTEIAVKSRGRADDLAITLGNASRRIGNVAFSEDARCEVVDGKLAKVVLGKTEVNVLGKLAGTLQGEMSPSTGAFRADIDVGQTDLSVIAEWVPIVADLAPAKGGGVPSAVKLARLKRYAGAVRVKTGLSRASADAAIVSSGNLSVRNPTLDGRPLTGQDVSAEWSGISLKTATREFAAPSIKLNAGVASITASDVLGSLGKVKQMKGNVQAQADLAGVLPALSRIAGWTALPAASGRLNWSALVSSDGTRTSMSGRGTVDDLKIGTGPQAFSDRRVEFTHQADLDPQAETLLLRKFTVTSTPISATMTGSVAQYARNCVLDLSGQYQGTWEKIMPLVYQFYPRTAGNVVLTGATGGPFVLKGPANDLRLKPPYRGLSGNAQVSWTSANIYGLPLDKATLVLVLSDGRIGMPLTAIPSGAGRANLAGTVDFNTTPPTLHMPGELRVLENFTVTREFAGKLLNRFNPILGADAEAVASVRVRDIVLPLGEIGERTSTGSGRLDLSKLKVQPRGILGQLLALKDLSTDRVYEARDTGADFVIRNGRLEYKDFSLVFGRFDLMFSGSVGFDDRLDMVVSIPVGPEFLKKMGLKGPLGEIFGPVTATRINIPITGTRQLPVLDLGAAVKGLTIDPLEQIFKLIPD